LPSLSARRITIFSASADIGDDFPPDCLLARMRQNWSFSPGAQIAL
jgi:hypothetical protein